MFPYGRTRNPWNTDYEPGSSSSGSGAAVAAALCATSLGEDTSGSIRHPSSWCGVVGLRPTWGRVSRYGLMPIIWSMDQAGPMSRTVEDCAITLQPICGYDPKDPNTADVPVPDFRKALTGRLPAGESGEGFRVGVVKELVDDEQVTPEVRRAFWRAVEMLVDLGAEVEEVSVPLATWARLIFYTHMYVEMPARYKEWVDERLMEFDYDQQVKLLTGSLVPGQYYTKVQRLRSMLRRQVHDRAGTIRRVGVADDAGDGAADQAERDAGQQAGLGGLVDARPGPDAACAAFQRNCHERPVRLRWAGEGRDADRTADYRAALPGGRDSGSSPRLRTGDAVAPAEAGRFRGWGRSWAGLRGRMCPRWRCFDSLRSTRPIPLPYPTAHHGRGQPIPFSSPFRLVPQDGMSAGHACPIRPAPW